MDIKFVQWQFVKSQLRKRTRPSFLFYRAIVKNYGFFFFFLGLRFKTCPVFSGFYRRDEAEDSFEQ